MPGDSYDKSTRNQNPPAQTVPRLYRPGFISTSLFKYATNPANIEGYCSLIIAEVSGVIPEDPDEVVARVDVAIVASGETPGPEDYIGRGVPLVGNEVLKFMGERFLLPAYGELYLRSDTADTLTAYIHVDQFV